MTDVHFEKIALIGIGLIGSSLARVIRRRGLGAQISVYTRRAQTRQHAEALGLAHSFSETLTEAVRDADLVILCVPVRAYKGIAREITPALKKGCILTDVGSIKRDVIHAVVSQIKPDVHFIPGHPVAGTEESGPEAGFESLFEGQPCILTPVPNTDRQALERLVRFWEACGAQVDVMDAKTHDVILAITSHVPHLVAYAMMRMALQDDTLDKQKIFRYAGGGFRDFTRLASSHPEMWRDIFFLGKDTINDMGRVFIKNLEAIMRLMEWGDEKQMMALLEAARQVRPTLIEMGKEMPLRAFGRLPPKDSPEES